MHGVGCSFCLLGWQRRLVLGFLGRPIFGWVSMFLSSLGQLAIEAAVSTVLAGGVAHSQAHAVVCHEPRGTGRLASFWPKHLNFLLGHLALWA